MKLAVRRILPSARAGVLAAIVCLVFSGCFPRYGVVRPSTEIDKLFETGQIVPDHRYFVDGSDVRPNAILAVHNGYRLESALWRPVSPSQAQLRAWVDEMTRSRGYSLYTFGARIAGPDGRQIGFWYSPYRFTTVQLVGDKVVSIHTPDVSSSMERQFGFFAP